MTKWLFKFETKFAKFERDFVLIIVLSTAKLLAEALEANWGNRVIDKYPTEKKYPATAHPYVPVHY